MRTRLKDRYGRWAVLDPPDRPGRKVLCKCDCGTLREVWRYKLVDGSSESCGCYHNDLMRGKTFPDLAPQHAETVYIGARFGRWVVLTNPEPSGHRYTVQCRCDCGVEKAVATDRLLLGRTKSCGCLRRDAARAVHQTTDQAAEPRKMIS